MSQRTGSIAYLTFSAGFSLAVYALFVLLCDRCGLNSHCFESSAEKCPGGVHHPSDRRKPVKPYLPNDSPAWYLAAGFALYFAICTLLNRYLEKHELFLKL